MKRFNWKYVFIGIGLVLVVVLVIDFNQRLDTLNRQSTQLSTVQAEGTQVMQTQVALVTQVAYAGSDAAAEKWAYEKGRWVRQGESLVVPMPDGNAAPTPTPSPITATPKPQNWQIWLELFFGK
jgi:hypothetical protein